MLFPDKSKSNMQKNWLNEYLAVGIIGMQLLCVGMSSVDRNFLSILGFWLEVSYSAFDREWSSHDWWWSLWWNRVGQCFNENPRSQWQA